MGKARVCDHRCHLSHGTRCRCWCGGLFHGAGGAENRNTLSDVYGVPHGTALTERQYHTLTPLLPGLRPERKPTNGQ